MRHSFFFNTRKIAYRGLLSVITFMILAYSLSFTSFAETIDYQAEAEQRKELPIQSNETSGWPEGPQIGAEAAIVMDASTGTILYAKNIHEELYPASTTKIMTCLLAVENASLSDKITFSNEAVFSVPRDGSSIGMDVGESITLEQALFGIMVGSANEVANAVAEHVSGSIDAFVNLMNQRASELGCTNTHFNNTNGLQDDDHYTSAYDLALIARAFFNNELLCKVGNTPRYHFTETSTQPDDFYLNNKHKLITGEVKFDGIIGGKTGYTDQARETLVTCAERDGVKLICVILKEESPSQFTDTVTLFNYGFNNFTSVNVADTDTRYMPNDSLFFESENDVFGRSGTILSLSKSSTIIIPKTSSINDTDYSVSYDLTEDDLSSSPNAIAKISYTYNGVPIGTALLCYAAQRGNGNFGGSAHTHTTYINVYYIFISAAAFVVLMTIISTVSARVSLNRRYTSKSDRLRYKRRKREYKKGKLHFK
ncbi:D-alanyl-D-alanine carboxypeptidase family protein [Butyrivibrio proteoclasticus]|uniref:D-alanyl-D-alanine carboxypeptidase family protein n=1 Tax=Butyrivibrio proteoclasticus TaxID=43305 RepID=UPI000ACAFDC1|nr:D-alanyl-D-alanine carboxypeptidase family protein [Butyrivibrio proteoclasticus]